VAAFRRRFISVPAGLIVEVKIVVEIVDNLAHKVLAVVPVDAFEVCVFKVLLIPRVSVIPRGV
jgi:hypothetical protein